MKIYRYNKLKLQVLALFASIQGEWLAPNDAAERLDFFPARSAWTYFKRLWSFGLLERRSRGRGTLEYRISELGRERLHWLRTQKGWYVPPRPVFAFKPTWNACLFSHQGNANLVGHRPKIMNNLETKAGALPRFYVLDTNIWLDLTRGKVSCNELSSKAHIDVVIAPFVIMELMKETVKHKGKYFENDKHVFQCMSKFRVLELTKVFIHQRLWNSGEEASVNVGPKNYKKLLQMMVESGSYDEFIKKTKSAGSEWFQAETWDATHEGVLDKELRAVEQLGKVDPKSIATGFVKLYQFKGSFPKEDAIEKEFSAALEYLHSVIVKVRNGANLAKNDRGMYVDFQILFYLADPNATIVSNEGFSSEISKSPQRDRIITLSQFLLL